MNWADIVDTVICLIASAALLYVVITWTRKNRS